MSQMLIIKGPELTKMDTTTLPKQNTFINEIKQIPGVSGAAFSGVVPGDELRRNPDIQKSDQHGGDHFTILDNWISPGFISLYQMKMLSGRTFVNTDVRPYWIDGPLNLILN